MRPQASEVMVQAVPQADPLLEVPLYIRGGTRTSVLRSARAGSQHAGGGAGSGGRPNRR